jgi:long-chain acyl-CoA synthetase
MSTATALDALPEARRTGRSVAVVGGGFGGIAAAVMLRRAGHDDVTVFERGERVGGVWHHNTYPGAAGDPPLQP